MFRAANLALMCSLLDATMALAVILGTGLLTAVNRVAEEWSTRAGIAAALVKGDREMMRLPAAKKLVKEAENAAAQAKRGRAMVRLPAAKRVVEEAEEAAAVQLIAGWVMTLPGVNLEVEEWSSREKKAAAEVKEGLMRLSDVNRVVEEWSARAENAQSVQVKAARGL